MKTIFISRLAAIASLLAMSCSKQSIDLQPVTVKVKASVQNAVPAGGGVQQYWKAGVIFDRAVNVSGSATVTWYFAAGAIHGNPSNHYTQSFNFALDGSSNGCFVFTPWKVDGSMVADSVKVAFIAIEQSGYNIVIQ